MLFWFDPMLATGWSATAAIAQLKERGARSIRFVCLVSCPAGLDQVHRAHPEVPIFTAAIDSELNDRAYIVPGLGDAGDRYFGTVGSGVPDPVEHDADRLAPSPLPRSG